MGVRRQSRQAPTAEASRPIAMPRPASPAHFRGGAAQGRSLHRGRGGRDQPSGRLRRRIRHRHRGRRCRCSTSTRRSPAPGRSPISRSSRPSRCATPTSPSCWCCASCCFRWRRVSATASTGGTSCAACSRRRILIYAIVGGEDFTDRATMPTQTDVVLGVMFIVLLLEATRRTIGWIVPVVALAFIAYAHCGPVSAAALDPPRLRHRAGRRPPVHHARGHLRHSGRRLGDA